MLIISSTLFRDTLNFFRNQLANILLLALLVALINVLLGHALLPKNEQLEQLINMGNSIHISDTANMNLQQLVKQISVEKQCALLKASAAITLADLMSNVLLSSGLLAMIRQISNHQPTSMLSTIKLSVLLLPRLLLLIFLTTLLVQLGLLLVIIPGILLAIAFSLAPIIAASDNLDAIKSMSLSANLAFANFRLLSPAILFWLIAKATVFLLATQFNMAPSIMVEILLHVLSNIISTLLIIYLYRLYMLLQR